MMIKGFSAPIWRIWSKAVTTQILAASIRTANHVRQAALIGADAATMPAKALIAHPLTEAGLSSFDRDWKSTGQSVL